MTARTSFSVAVLLLLSIALHQGDAGGVTFSYDSQDTWADEFEFCGGDRQSPINLDRFTARSGFMWSNFRFENYGKLPTEQDIKNLGNGVAVVPKFKDGEQPTMSGGGLGMFAEYTFSSFHLHWGSDSSQGSEHTLDTVKYPMELHLVHYKSSYDGLDEAIEKSDGLAVLGIMFVISSEENPALVPFIAHLADIRDASGTTEATVTDMYALSSLLPDDLDDFYRYSGSLTTPTCNEVVTWTVFKQPITISEAQMTEIRSLMDVNGDNIVNNYRELQELNGRRVYQS